MFVRTVILTYEHLQDSIDNQISGNAIVQNISGQFDDSSNDSSFSL